MLITLSDECPIFSATAHADLHKFLSTIRSSRHILVRPAPEKLRGILAREVWDVYGDFITQSYKRATNRGQRLVYHNECTACDPAKMSEFYALPAVIVVENATTDGEWLKLIVEKLRAQLRWIFAGATPALDVRQAGGVGEIPKELARTAAPRMSIRPKGNVPLGVIALCDSDARVPGAWSDSARAVVSTASDVGASAHVLAKRTIENYVPIEALQAYSRTRTHTAAALLLLEGLSDVQHDHFPMKDGLAPADLEASGSVFSCGGPMGVGFGDFMSDFLSRFRYHTAPRDLRRRDTANELEELLTLIEECV